MVQYINEFTQYCQQIGILEEKEEFLQEGDELSNILFMHLLTLNRLSLIELAKRVSSIWLNEIIQPNQVEILKERNQSQQNNSSKSNSKVPSNNNNYLYNNYLCKEEVNIIKQQQNLNEQMKDCTFQPKISKKSQGLEMNAPVHERLSKFGCDKKIKQQISIELRDKNEMKTCTFRPQVNSSTQLLGDPFNRLYNNALTQRNKMDQQEEEEECTHQPQLISAPIHPQDYTSVPVEERLYYRHFDQMQNMIIKQEKVQEQELKDCTFTPQINHSNQKQDSSVFQRLYNHSQAKSSSDMRDSQQQPQSTTLVNRKSEKLLKNAGNESSQYVSQFSVEQSPFDRLYSEHKRIERKKKVLEQQEYQKITFKPQTNKK